MKWKSSRSASAWLTLTHLLCCQMLHFSHATLCVPSSIWPYAPQMQSNIQSSSSARSSRACFFLSISAFRCRSDNRPCPDSSFLLSSDRLASSSSWRIRRASLSFNRCSLVIIRDSRSFSSFVHFSCSFLAIASSACRFLSASRTSSSCRCCSSLPAILLDLFAVASFSRFSNSRSFCVALRFRASSCFSRSGKRSSSIRFRKIFSLASRLFSIEARKELSSSKVTATHSHFIPPKPSSSLSGVTNSSAANSSA